MNAVTPLRVVITGASSGLGLALARHYLERGATVAALARRGELLQTLTAEFSDRVFCYMLDVRDSPALQNAANDFIARAGVPDVVSIDGRIIGNGPGRITNSIIKNFKEYISNYTGD